MANRIKGITIEIGGDTTPLQKALKDVNSSLRDTQNQLKDVDKLLKLDPGNMELLRQKQTLLGKAVEDTEKKLQQEKDALEQLKAGPQTEETIKQQNALEREIIETSNALNDYKQKLAQADPALAKIGSTTDMVAEKTKKLSAVAAGVGIALLGNAYNSARAADDLNTLAKQTGFTTEELQKMQYASDLIDVSVDSMTGSMKKLTSHMSSESEVFDKLGVAIYDSNGEMRNATDVWYDSLEALSQVSNETERDALSMELFGKSASDLSGIIDDGGKALRELGDEASDLGLILDQDALDAANEFNDAMDRMKARSQAAVLKMGNALAGTLVPAIEKLLDKVTKVVTWFSKLDGSTQKVILVVLALVAAISPVAKTISTVTKTVNTLKTAFIAFNPTVLVIIAVIGALIAVGVLLYKNWDTIKEKLGQLASAVSTKFSEIKNAISTKINEAKSAVETAVNRIVSFFDLSGKSWKLPDISGVLDGIKQTAKGIIDKIGDFFDLSGWSWNIPTPKLPHLSWGTKKAEGWVASVLSALGMTTDIPVPKIDWYKSAYNNPVLFRDPTVLATPNGLKGFGDGNGGELVIGMNKLKELMGTGITVNMTINGNNMNANELSDLVIQKLTTTIQRNNQRF